MRTNKLADKVRGGWREELSRESGEYEIPWEDGQPLTSKQIADNLTIRMAQYPSTAGPPRPALVRE